MIRHLALAVGLLMLVGGIIAMLWPIDPEFPAIQVTAGQMAALKARLAERKPFTVVYLMRVKVVSRTEADHPEDGQAVAAAMLEGLPDEWFDFDDGDPWMIDDIECLSGTVVE